MAKPAYVEVIDEHTVAAEALLLRAAADHAICIVEGPSDAKVLSKFQDDDSCAIIIAHGKSNALLALTILEARKMNGILAVVDKDFDDLLGVDMEAPNAIRTCRNDMENELINSSAFDAFVTEICSASKLSNKGHDVTSFRKLIMSLAHEVGVIRFASSVKELNLDFKRLKYRCCDRATMCLNAAELRREVLAQNDNCLSDDELEKLCSEAKTGIPEDVHLGTGHDAVSFLTIALRSFAATLNAVEAAAERIGSCLRLAYSDADFRSSGLCEKLKTWESRNAPYIVLRHLN